MWGEWSPLVGLVVWFDYGWAAGVCRVVFLRSFVMIGADLGQMDDLASRMSQTSVAVLKCQGSTDSATKTVVASVTAEARAALQKIQGELTELRSSVAGSVATANSTSWTGANAVKFRGSASEFDGAMQRAETATADAFTKFQASIQQMADALEAYQASFSGALTNADASVKSMEAAVVGQRNYLDEAMNRGMNVG